MSRYRVERGGMSLLELVVACALFAVLAVAIVQVVVPSLRLVAVSSQRGGLQQHAMIVLTRIETALRRSSDFGIGLQLAGGSQALLMGVHQRESSAPFSGQVRWDSVMTLFAYTGDELHEKLYQGADAGLAFDANHPLRLSAPQLQALHARPATRSSVLARDVAQFRMERSAQATYTVTLELVGNPKSERFRLTRSTTLRM